MSVVETMEGSDGATPADPAFATTAWDVTVSGRAVHVEIDESGRFFAAVPSLPGCHTDGATLAEATDGIAEAISLFDECPGPDPKVSRAE